MVDQDKSTIISITLFGLSGLFSSFFFFGGMSIAYAPALLFLGIALLLSWDKDIKIPLHTLILFGFVLYSGVSIFWSGTPYITLVSWLILLAFPLSYLLGRCVHIFAHGKRGSIYLLVGFGILASLYGGVDMFLNDKNRLHALFANPNTFSGFLVLCLVPCVAFLIHRQDKKLLWAILSLFFLLTILLTGSRSGILTTCISLVLIFSFSSVQGKWKYIALFLVSTFIMGIIFYLNDAPFITRIIHPLGGEALASTQGRLIIWEGSWALARDHLLMGTGLGTFFLDYPVYRLPNDPSVGDWAHFDSLQILSEVGVIGCSLWICFWTSLLCSAIKHRKKLSPYALVGFIGCFALFFQGHLTYLYLILPLLIVIGFYLALYDSELCGGGASKYTTVITRKWATLPLALILFLAVQSSLSVLMVKQAQQNMFKSNIDRAKQQIALIDAFGAPYFYEHLMVLGKRGDLGALEQVKTRCSSCSEPYFVSGLIHLQQKEVRLAKQEIWAAMQKDPSNQNIRLHFIRIFEQEGRLKEAATIAQQGFSYPIEHEQKLYFKEVILKSQKNQ